MCIEFEAELLERLRVKFGLKEEKEIAKKSEENFTGTTLNNLQDKQDLHLTNNDTGFRDVDLAVDLHENQTSTGNLQEENLRKYGVDVNPVDVVDVSKGVEEKTTSDSWEEETDKFLREVEEL